MAPSKVRRSPPIHGTCGVAEASGQRVAPQPAPFVSPRVCQLQERETAPPRYRVRSRGDESCPHTNDANMRRTVFATAKGAAGTLLMSPGRADEELPRQRGPYRIEDWGKTWINPDKARVLVGVPAIAMPDIGGYWPYTTRPVRGPQEYVIDLLDFIPDFRAEPIEHATIGDVMFVRWIARGTGPNGAVQSGRRGSTDRSPRLRCGEPYPFGSSDLRCLRKTRGGSPRRLARATRSLGGF